MVVKPLVFLVLITSTVEGFGSSKSASCSSPVFDISQTVAGESLLASGSRISRALTQASTSLGMTLSVKLGKHRAWRIEHEKARKTANETKSMLDRFIEAQTSSSDACSSRLKESKRVLDGLLRDLNAVQDQFVSHEELLKTESENLKITHAAIEAAEDTWDSETKECQKQKDDALADLQMYNNELQELQQIANPSIRYEHSISVKLPEKGDKYNAASNQSLLELGVFSESSCNAFKAFSLHAKVVTVERAKNLTCDEQREQLQEVFTETWINVVNLINEAKERVKDTTCFDSANAKRTAALVPQTAMREQASARIEHSEQALALLSPILDMLKRRVEKLQEHIDLTLTPECKEAVKVQSSLNTVRELILSLEKCPGRNDFMLKIPTEETIATVTTTPSPPSESPSPSVASALALQMTDAKSNNKTKAGHTLAPKVMEAKTHHHHHHKHNHTHDRINSEVRGHGEVHQIVDDQKDGHKSDRNISITVESTSV